MYTFFLCFQIFLFICKSDLWMQNLIGLLIIKDLHFYICLYYFYNWGFISVFVVVFLNILDNYMWLELSFFYRRYCSLCFTLPCFPSEFTKKSTSNSPVFTKLFEANAWWQVNNRKQSRCDVDFDGGWLFLKWRLVFITVRLSYQLCFKK